MHGKREEKKYRGEGGIRYKLKDEIITCPVVFLQISYFVMTFYLRVIKDMQAESPLTSVSFMHDGAAFAVGTTRGKHSVKLC